MSQPGQLSHGLPPREPISELARRNADLDRSTKERVSALTQSIQALTVAMNTTPRAQMSVASAGQSITNGAYNAISFDTTNINNNGMWAAGAPTQLTAVTAGKYLISGAVGFAANSTGRRQSAIRLNGVTLLTQNEVVTVAAPSVTNCPIPAFEYPLAVGDYVELMAFQSSGAGLLTSVAYPLMTFMRVAWCGV